jgi:hypothetical protein
MISLTSTELLNISTYDKYNSKEITVIVDSTELTNFNIHAVYFGHIPSKCHTTLKYLNQLDFKAVQFDTTHHLYTIKTDNKAVYIYHKGSGFAGDSSSNPPSPPPSPINFPPTFLPKSSSWPKLSLQQEEALCNSSYTFMDPPTTINSKETGWIHLIENNSTSIDDLGQFSITYEQNGRYSHYKFGARIYPIDQQVWLSPYTIIEGAKDPNVHDNPQKRSGNEGDHTIFYSLYAYEGFTRGYCIPTKNTSWTNETIWGGLPLKCTRQGFLMNTNTIIRNCIIQGGTVSGGGGVSDSGMGLSGGGLIELPGCATAYRDKLNGKLVCGGKYERINSNDYSHPKINTLHKFWTGDTGGAVSNVLVENIRANMYTDNSNNKNINRTFFWSSMNIKDQSHNNIILRRIVSLQTSADGINVHGNVQGFVGEDLYFENVKDDTVAIWGVGGGECACNTHDSNPNGCPSISNTVASNIRFERVFARKSLNIGECYRIIGAKDVSFIDITCCDISYPNNPTNLMGIMDTYCAQFPENSIIDISGGRVINGGTSSVTCPIDLNSNQVGMLTCDSKGYTTSNFTQLNSNSCENNKLTTASQGSPVCF